MVLKSKKNISEVKKNEEKIETNEIEFIIDDNEKKVAENMSDVTNEKVKETQKNAPEQKKVATEKSEEVEFSFTGETKKNTKIFWEKIKGDIKRIGRPRSRKLRSEANAGEFNKKNQQYKENLEKKWLSPVEVQMALENNMKNMEDSFEKWAKNTVATKVLESFLHAYYGLPFKLTWRIIWLLGRESVIFKNRFFNGKLDMKKLGIGALIILSIWFKAQKVGNDPETAMSQLKQTAGYVMKGVNGVVDYAAFPLEWASNIVKIAEGVITATNEGLDDASTFVDETSTAVNEQGAKDEVLASIKAKSKLILDDETGENEQLQEIIIQVAEKKLWKGRYKEINIDKTTNVWLKACGDFKEKGVVNRTEVKSAIDESISAE